MPSVIVVGASGSEEYGKQFAAWAEQWESAAWRGEAQVVRIGVEEASKQDADGKVADRDRLREQLATTSQNGAAPLWLVLIGHGTFDGRRAKFNLRGPDITPEDLAQWCAPIKRPIAIIDCSSASGPFLNELSAGQRVVITATRSGQEQNFARFGGELAAAIGDPSADLDKDGQTSLLEAYLHASRRVDEFYAAAARLATEHALLDDNGDKQGTPAGGFQGVRAKGQAKEGAAPDGALAHRWHLVPGAEERSLTPAGRQRRDELEQAIAKLRESKAEQSEDEYFGRLEKLMIELARLNFPATPPAKNSD